MHIPRVKVTQNFAQYPLQHVNYTAAKFEVATSNGLGGDAFIRKYFLDLDLDCWPNALRPSQQLW